MNIRVLEPKDLPIIEEIHAKYHNGFPLPDFTKFAVAFVVEDETGRVITGGGVRAIIESLIVTDNSISVRDRRQALLMVLEASLHFTKQMGGDHLHAFIGEEENRWYDQLKRYGFKDCYGRAVYIDT